MGRVLLLTCLVLGLVAVCGQAQVFVDVPSGPLVRTGMTNMQHPLNRGLIAWWRVIPELAGGPRWYDLVGTGHGTLSQMAAAGTSGWSTSLRRGSEGEMRFDGTNDYVEVAPQLRLNDVRVKTVTFWLNATGFGGAGSGRIVDKRQNGGWTIAVNSTNNRLTLTQDLGTTLGQWGVNSGIILGEWHWYAVAHDSTVTTNAPTFYCDGVPCADVLELSAPSGSYVADTTSPLRLGDADGDGARALPGSLDDIRIYNRLLTASEIRLLYEQTLAPQEDLLVRHPLPLFGTTASTGFFQIFGN